MIFQTFGELSVPDHQNIVQRLGLVKFIGLYTKLGIVEALYFAKTANKREEERNAGQAGYLPPLRKRTQHKGRRPNWVDNDDFIVDDLDELTQPSNALRIWNDSTTLRRQSIQRLKREERWASQFTLVCSAAIGGIDVEGHRIRSQKQAENFDSWLEKINRKILTSMFASSAASTSQTMSVPFIA
jgi:hypothetical protein